MKKILPIFLVLAFSASLLGAEPATYSGNNSSSRILLNKKALSNSFSMNQRMRSFQSESNSGSLFNTISDLGIYFVIANTTSYFQHKNNVFYKKANYETGNIYTDNYFAVNNWLHFEILSPVLNISYESTFPVSSSFPTTPRYSKLHFDLMGVTGDDLLGWTVALYSPFVTRTLMSTRDYTKSLWDIRGLGFMAYRITNETFLNEGDTYRIRERRFYWLSTTTILEIMSAFSRYMQLACLKLGVANTGIGIGGNDMGGSIPHILPVVEFYNATTIRENANQDEWLEVQRVKSKFNMEFGVMYINEFRLSKVNMVIQPYFRWIMYSSRNIKTDQGLYNGFLVRESSMEASLSIQYVF